MRQFNAALVCAALARQPFIIPPTEAQIEKAKANGGTPLFRAEITVATIDQRPNGSSITSYIPVTLTGPAAERLVARIHENGDQPTALLIEGVWKQDRWETPEGEKKSRVKIKALRTEIVAEPGEFITDANKALRLKDGLNETRVGGNLTGDVEVIILPDGTKKAEVGMALNNTYYTNAGQKVEEVSYVRVVFWRALAEQVEGLKKGAAITVIGAVTSESWVDKTTKKQTSTIKVEAYRVIAIQVPPAAESVPGAAQGRAEKAPVLPTPTAEDFPEDETDLPF